MNKSNGGRYLFSIRAIALCLGLVLSGCTTTGPTQSGGSAARSRDLVTRILEKASQAGVEIVHNATVVPSGAYAPGQITFPAGTEYDAFSPDGTHVFYKNKEDTLTTAGAKEGIKYVAGKGVVKYGGKMYCFGF